MERMQKTRSWKGKARQSLTIGRRGKSQWTSPFAHPLISMTIKATLMEMQATRVMDLS